jgi:hypothetical protein
MTDMKGSISLERLSQYIEDNVHQIGVVRKEVEEIQVGFNSAYVEWKAEHDAALERLVEAVTARLGEVGPDLQGQIEKRVGEERRTIAERRQELRDRLIPETQGEADRVLQEGQKLTEKLRKENPRLDEREETLKQLRAMQEQELNQLNDQIRALSGCLGVVINFLKINKLDRQRQRVIGQLKEVHRQLRGVREEWQEVHQETQAEQETLQAQWQELALKLTQLQGESDYLDDETSRENLALRRATRYVLDNLKEPVPCSAGDLRGDLDGMIEANVQTDDYQEGLGSVAGLLALLDGISEGLDRFNGSVEGLIREQQMHSAYLSKLQVTVPGNVVAFHGQWGDLAQKVHDDGRLCANPTEFLEVIRPILAESLSDASIRVMFEDLGQALTSATSRWR